MRAVVYAALLVSAFSGAAIAQEQKVYAPSVDFGENTNAYVRILETSKGPDIGKAVLDLCFANNIDFSNSILLLGDYDRVVVPLKIDANSATGTATSTEAKRAVAANFQRRALADGKVSFTGTISIDGKSFQVSGDPVFGHDVTEDIAFLQSVEKPESFDESAAPNSLAVKVKRGSLPQLIEAVRASNVKVDLTGGGTDKCEILRSGVEYLRLMVPPPESEALVARLRKLPFVISAGWTSAISAMPAVRIGDARWVTKGVLDRQKAASDFSAAIAKHIGASVTGTLWDTSTGELKITFKRPSKLFPGLGLTENFEAVALIAPERFGETDKAVVWTPTISGDVVDETTGSRLSVVPLTLYAGPPQGIVVYIEPEVLPRLLDGEWRDGDWIKR